MQNEKLQMKKHCYQSMKKCSNSLGNIFKFKQHDHQIENNEAYIII